MIDFDTYIKMGEPGGKERAEAWKTAIGLPESFDGRKRRTHPYKYPYKYPYKLGS